MKQKEDIIAKLLALSKQRMQIRKEILVINERLNEVLIQEENAWSRYLDYQEQLETSKKTENTNYTKSEKFYGTSI
jgi:hypothetical protein